MKRKKVQVLVFGWKWNFAPISFSLARKSREQVQIEFSFCFSRFHFRNVTSLAKNAKSSRLSWYINFASLLRLPSFPRIANTNKKKEKLFLLFSASAFSRMSLRSHVMLGKLIVRAHKMFSRLKLEIFLGRLVLLRAISAVETRLNSLARHLGWPRKRRLVMHHREQFSARLMLSSRSRRASKVQGLCRAEEFQLSQTLRELYANSISFAGFWFRFRFPFRKRCQPAWTLGAGWFE